MARRSPIKSSGKQRTAGRRHPSPAAEPAHALAVEEAARLRAEVDYLRHSRAFKLGTAWDMTLSFLDVRSWSSGQPVPLAAGANIRSKGMRGSATVWALDGEDPQLEMGLADPLCPGHYSLALELPGHERQAVAAELYVDSGRGYREGERIDLILRPAGPHHRAVFSLPEGAVRLRFDPPAGRKEIEIGRVRLRRLFRAAYYLGGLTRLVTDDRKSGRPLRIVVGQAVRLLKTGGPRALAATIRERLARSSTPTDYAAWIARHDELTPARLDELQSRVGALSDPPLISVLMPVFDPPERLLREAIESVRSQVYERWELCIADDHSTRPHVAKMLRAYADLDPRIKVVFRETNGHIGRATNSAFGLAGGDWLALLDHDDVLRPHALAELALEIARRPDAALIYSDEDKLSPDGERLDPYFKPDFSRELLRSQNYFNHLTAYRADVVRAVGGWRPGYEGSQDYDLNLRVFERVGGTRIHHIAKVLYHWRAGAGSTASSGTAKNYAYRAGLRALEDHLRRTGLAAGIEAAPGVQYYRVRPALPDPSPLVSLIIPTRDRGDLLGRCVRSILEQTSYRTFEVLIVDNGTAEKRALATLAELSRHANVRVLRYDKPFNFSAINNFAVRHARGTMLALVNNDVEVIAPDWLTEMVSWAGQPDVGCVGAKLYYPNETIQHAGVVLGIGGVAGHSHRFMSRAASGYFARLKIVHNVSAVTAACLVVRKSIYEQVEGLNEADLPVAFNDVDFCLRVREAGYTNVFTPYAELYHHESVSRGAEDSPQKLARFQREVRYMKQRWDLTPDPLYSPHLTYEREDFSLGR